MYTAKIQNAQGEILQLNDQESKWAVLSITGLNPAPSQLNMAEIYGMDGSRMNYAKLTARNIVIMLRLCGDVEENRLEIYRLFPQKVPIRFFYKTKTRDVYIDGYVETIEGDLYTQNEIFQISILCPDPFFKSVENYTVELQNSQGGFEFPVAIDQDDPIEFGSYEAARVTTIINDSQIDMPFELFIECFDEDFQPKIQNLDTGEFIGIAKLGSTGEKYYINTDPANIKAISIKNGVTSNLIPGLNTGSTFWQLHPGENHIGYKTLGGLYDNDGTITLKYRKLYRGV